ncbi:MFS-type transporter clz9-like [Diprion similis]|uniref:MFS-type transporter clz9-like n=1 Tax=Diprion similis TaxID=362088 RepID=UPI001EF7D970|nr:MFS-type transporter clz9-like [Diprion similis]
MADAQCQTISVKVRARSCLKMARHYQRKTETKYKLVDLEKAVEAVKNKTLSLGKAAITYSVPKSTIHDYLKKKTIKTPKAGRKAIFSQEQEVELEDHILKCWKEWFYGFKKRHPNISLRKPESTSINSITAFNETEVKMFFNNLESLQIKYQFDANRIYNVDETGISNVQRNSRILAPKGQKQVGMITSGERGTTTTVVCAFSTSGNYIPQFFIFKRKRMNAQLLRGSNSDMIAAVSDSGWINENLFVDWLHHFISYAKPSVGKPILLVLDNHESHVSLGCYLLCRQNGIVLLSLPPHTSHRMQPLDLTYFGPLKTAYNRECDLYMASNVGQRITQYEVVELFTKAFNRISNIEKAASGFRSAGIWPLDTTKFDEQFLEATLPDTQSIPLSNIQTPATQAAQASKEKGPITPDAQMIKPINQTAQLDESIPLQEIVNVPQISQPETKQTSKKRHSIITSTPMKDGQEEYYCLICNEKYAQPITEDWIMCYKCRLWAHEKCTIGERTSKDFLCDFCAKCSQLPHSPLQTMTFDFRPHIDDVLLRQTPHTQTWI